MSIKDPNFSSKLSGSLLLRSDATFTPTLPSEHGEMTKKFRTAHQAANDEIADKIVAGVKSGKLAPDKRGKVPYDQDMAEKEIRESLDKKDKQGGIRVNIDDFELDQLKVKVKINTTIRRKRSTSFRSIEGE